MADKLKVGILTTWNTRCGIAEYSRYLVNALRKRDDVDVVVLGSRNYDQYKVAEDEDYVIPVFDVQPWNQHGYHGLDVEIIQAQNLDVLHVQYEVLLYNQQGLQELLESNSYLKVVTYHDNCIPPSFPFNLFDLRYTHRENVGIGEGFILPMGVENRTPVVKTFGLGRSREDLIAEICFQNNWRFEKSFGEQNWKSPSELYNWLRESDAIVLYYDDVHAAGSSIAARVAISTRRPVFINDVTWFEEFTKQRAVPNLTIVSSREVLEQHLKQTFSNWYIEEYSWDKIAHIHVKDYENAMSRLQRQRA